MLLRLLLLTMLMMALRLISETDLILKVLLLTKTTMICYRMQLSAVALAHVCQNVALLTLEMQQRLLHLLLIVLLRL